MQKAEAIAGDESSKCPSTQMHFMQVKRTHTLQPLVDTQGEEEVCVAVCPQQLTAQSVILMNSMSCVYVCVQLATI